MSDKVYKIKDNIDINYFGTINYDLFPNTTSIVFKIIPQPIEGELAQATLKNIYNNPLWKERFYEKYKKRLIQELGLKYGKDGKAILSKKFESILTKWRIQIDFQDDRWVGFTSLDFFDNSVYYNTKVLDKYCHDEIQFLKSLDLLEEVDVSDYNSNEA